MDITTINSTRVKPDCLFIEDSGPAAYRQHIKKDYPPENYTQRQKCFWCAYDKWAKPRDGRYLGLTDAMRLRRTSDICHVRFAHWWCDLVPESRHSGSISTKDMPAIALSGATNILFWEPALASARTAVGLCEPNPRVGCVIQTIDGAVYAGHTQHVGGPHAEIMALSLAREQGARLSGATAFVTLEPCSHHGRTPPCCDALIAAGITRVVIATTDPNPLVAGQGVERLRAAGMDVTLLPSDDAVAQAARELNIGFFSRMIRKTPWVRMKMAASLDGTSALHNGVSQWITSEDARTDGHRWRARACAVVTGVGTILEDDPMLDVRRVPASRQPHLVVVDSRLETPPTARLFSPPAHGLPRQVWIYCAQPDTARRVGTSVPTPPLGWAPVDDGVPAGGAR